MRLLRQREIPLHRTPVTGSYDSEGTWVAGATRPRTIKCSVQPYNGGIETHKELQGVRTSGLVELYSKQCMRTTSEDYLTQGDLVEPYCDGILYEVYRVQPWQGASHRTSHIRAYAYKLDDQKGKC